MLKEVCHMATSFPAIYFLYDSAIILREHLKQSICQGHCVYFTTLVVAIYYDKQTVFDSRKFERYFCLRKTMVGLLFYFTE